MQVSPYVFQMHYNDHSDFHPGGSSNYFVGDPEDEMVLIDAGDLQRGWTDAILDYHESLGSPRIKAIMITHGHPDHIGGLDRLQEAFDCVVHCHSSLADRLTRMLGGHSVQALKWRSRVEIGDSLGIRPVFTPGHTEDHLCYYFPKDRVMFTGDTVLGASSTSVSDVATYMRSLRMLVTYRHKIICPGHGPVAYPPRGTKLVQEYIEHRMRREWQILSAVRDGHETAVDITTAVYSVNLKKSLRAAAERNVVAHLRKLIDEGEVEEAGSVRYSPA